MYKVQIFTLPVRIVVSGRGRRTNEWRQGLTIKKKLTHIHKRYYYSQFRMYTSLSQNITSCGENESINQRRYLDGEWKRSDTHPHPSMPGNTLALAHWQQQHPISSPPLGWSHPGLSPPPPFTSHPGPHPGWSCPPLSSPQPMPSSGVAAFVFTMVGW